MEVQVTKLFVKNYRRYNNRAKVRNVLRDMRNRMDASPNWLHGYKHMQNCALTPTFRATLSKGDRLIMNHKPPLLILDVGNHDTYDTWDKGHTKASVQIQRAEDLASVPEWVFEIFESR